MKKKFKLTKKDDQRIRAMLPVQIQKILDRVWIIRVEHGNLKRGWYEYFKEHGLYDVNAILTEYNLIHEKKSVHPSNIREVVQIIVNRAIIECYDAIMKEKEQDGKEAAEQG